MSYYEYFDLFYSAQKKRCKYRAFLIDVKNSREVLASYKEYYKFHSCVDYIVEKLTNLGKLKNNEILFFTWPTFR